MTRAIIFLLAVNVAACDFLYGVRRSAPIEVEPDSACIERVIRTAPGVVTVEHSREEGGRPLTWSGIQAPTVVHTFLYHGPDNVSGVLQYTTHYDGTHQYWQSLLALNRTPPQEQVTATRPVMRHIERAIDQQCGLAGLADQVTEWCKAVSCPPLDQ